MLLLLKGNPIFTNLAVSKLKLPDVLTKLSNGAFTGYASFVFQSCTAILVFEAGKLVGVLVERQNGKRESGVAALSTLAELMVTTGSGSLNVYKLSKDFTTSILAILEGGTLQELKRIDTKSLLEKVTEDQMNCCLRIYRDEHSTMILSKDGTLGFLHDGTNDTVMPPSESQKNGAKMEKVFAERVNEVKGTNLLEVTNIQKIWDTCVALHKSEIGKTNHEHDEQDGKVMLQKRAELEEQVKVIVSEYIGKVGRGIVDKEISDNGGNTCLVDADGEEKFLKNVERTAKLLVSDTNIRLMMEKLSSKISSAKAGL